MKKNKEQVYFVSSQDCQNHVFAGIKQRNVYTFSNGIEKILCLGGFREILRTKGGEAILHLDFKSVKRTDLFRSGQNQFPV